MKESRLPTDSEIDLALAAAGINPPAELRPRIREACRALKQLAFKLAERPLE